MTKKKWGSRASVSDAHTASHDERQLQGKEILDMLHKSREPEQRHGTSGQDILDMVQNAPAKDAKASTQSETRDDSKSTPSTHGDLPDGFRKRLLSDRSTDAPNDIEGSPSIVQPSDSAMNFSSLYPSPGASPMVPMWTDPSPESYDPAWWLPTAYDSCMLWHESMLAAGHWDLSAYTGDIGFGACENAMYSIEEMPEQPKTTVMLRNLPTAYTRAHLLELLEDEGFAGSFDFVYCPMDFTSKCCLGYAFVNFVSASDAARCWEIFDGYHEWGTSSEKVCEVTWGDPLQGLEAHVERYRNSPVMHASVPQDWQPVIFKDGTQIEFPPPTKAIKAPKLRAK
eukprot:TRINITY_DN39203_c0_g1_i1.p1 TRINITY_DN39203_c0_g1~~TRINITY_DN39203_c0_g1_i1.p1  ORF type:complete len:340 (-),score=42.49 TRINITY_DN39203_c0_g1_i1:215-1234(-)